MDLSQSGRGVSHCIARNVPTEDVEFPGWAYTSQGQLPKVAEIFCLEDKMEEHFISFGTMRKTNLQILRIPQTT